MASEILKRDENSAIVLGGITDDANQFIKMLRVDPVTGRLLISISGTSSITTSSITFIIDGGGSTIATGIAGDLEIPFNCTINRATLLADQSGSIVVDIWKNTYANYPPVVGNSITASAIPTITTAVKSQDATLTGWTTTINAGDTLRFNVNSVTTIQRITLSLRVIKT